ncbi:MAG: plasmid stabilization system protein ParE [Candidatus Azotimanducaceae bacterium]|jgi:plasmid stabilization system protein ParE
MESLHNLVGLMEIQYHHSRQSLQQVINEETQIRRELTVLQNHTHSARQLGLNDEPEMRAMGADILWERWLERSRAKLNVELARVLATKEMHITRVRRSFGKLQVANAKSNQVAQSEKKNTQVRNLDRAIWQTQLKNQ